MDISHILGQNQQNSKSVCHLHFAPKFLTTKQTILDTLVSYQCNESGIIKILNILPP